MLLDKVAEPVTINRFTAGTLARWTVEPGAAVARFDALAVVVDADEVECELVAPMAGTVARLVATPGETLESGAVVCFVQTDRPRPRRRIMADRGEPTTPPAPARTRQNAPQATQTDTPPKHPPAPAEPVERASERPSPAPAPVVELTLEPPPAPVPPARQRVQRRRPRPRVVKHTTHPLDTQRDALRQRADRLRRSHGYAESELHRLMYDLLAAVDDAGVVKMLEAQRDREQASYCGFGARPPA